MIVLLKLRPDRGPDALILAEYELPRDCPRCLGTGCRGSVIGHGRRRRTCLDQDGSEAKVRRGLCRACGGTITFLPSDLKP